MSCPNRRPAGVGIGLTLAVALSACHATVRPPAPPRPAPVQQLQHDSDAILAAPSLGHGSWGVVVRSLASRDTVYDAHGNRLMMPASNLKVATLAAAAERLTWSYTYETRLMAAGPVDDGELHGDLVVVGFRAIRASAAGTVRRRRSSNAGPTGSPPPAFTASTDASSATTARLPVPGWVSGGRGTTSARATPRP